MLCVWTSKGQKSTHSSWRRSPPLRSLENAISTSAGTTPHGHTQHPALVPEPGKVSWSAGKQARGLGVAPGLSPHPRGRRRTATRAKGSEPLAGKAPSPHTPPRSRKSSGKCCRGGGRGRTWPAPRRQDAAPGPRPAPPSHRGEASPARPRPGTRPRTTCCRPGALRPSLRKFTPRRASPGRLGPRVHPGARDSRSPPLPGRPSQRAAEGPGGSRAAARGQAGLPRPPRRSPRSPRPADLPGRAPRRASSPRGARRQRGPCVPPPRIAMTPASRGPASRPALPPGLRCGARSSLPPRRPGARSLAAPRAADSAARAVRDPRAGQPRPCPAPRPRGALSSGGHPRGGPGGSGGPRPAAVPSARANRYGRRCPRRPAARSVQGLGARAGARGRVSGQRGRREDPGERRGRGARGARAGAAALTSGWAGAGRAGPPPRSPGSEAPRRGAGGFLRGPQGGGGAAAPPALTPPAGGRVLAPASSLPPAPTAPRAAPQARAGPARAPRRLGARSGHAPPRPCPPLPSGDACPAPRHGARLYPSRCRRPCGAPARGLSPCARPPRCAPEPSGRGPAGVARPRNSMRLRPPPRLLPGGRPGA